MKAQNRKEISHPVWKYKEGTKQTPHQMQIKYTGNLHGCPI